MKRGFTIIELLTASLIFGILATILGMVLNQSSVAWRVGTGEVVNLDAVRDKMASIHEEADNVFVAESASGQRKLCRHIGLWGKKCTEYSERAWEEATNDNLPMLKDKESALLKDPGKMKIWSQNDNIVNNLGTAKRTGVAHTYIVNVMSAGPNGKLGDYDDIWSFPDDFE